MMASKAADKLRAIGCHNNWDLLKVFGDDVACAIEYHCPPPGRLGWASTRQSTVWSPRPRPGFANGWKKDFIGIRATSFPAAEAWAARRTHGAKFVPSPFGGRITERTLCEAMLKAAMVAALAP